MAKEVRECCSQFGFSRVEIFKDLQGKERMVLAQF
jgi:methylase of polypeptide subunit release factors